MAIYKILLTSPEKEVFIKAEGFGRLDENRDDVITFFNGNTAVASFSECSNVVYIVDMEAIIEKT